MSALPSQVSDANEYVRALDFADSYTRADALLCVYFRRALSRNDWFRTAGEEINGCDNLYGYRRPLARIMRGATRSELDLMMDAKERDALAALPEVLTVYRGCYGFNRLGLSWSLSADVARKFPTFYRYRHDGYTPLLLTGRVRKAACILKLDREEQEVIAPRVRIVATQELNAKEAA